MTGRYHTQATFSHIHIYEALEELEKNEGRGGVRRIGLFFERAHAEAAAAGMGAMGYEGPIREHDFDVVTYFDPKSKKEVTRKLGDVVELQFEDPAKVRERALAKLTAEEKLALGLK